jgi:hypothetical protein
MSKIQKTTLLFLIAIVSSLIVPVIGKWYFQQTGIEPIMFYLICGLGGLAMALMRIFSMVDEDLNI